MRRVRKSAAGGAGALLLIALVLFVAHPSVTYSGFVTSNVTGTVTTTCPSALNRAEGDTALTAAAVHDAEANYLIAYGRCKAAASDRQNLSIAFLVLAGLVATVVIVSRPRVHALAV